MEISFLIKNAIYFFFEYYDGLPPRSPQSSSLFFLCETYEYVKEANIKSEMSAVSSAAVYDSDSRGSLCPAQPELGSHPGTHLHPSQYGVPQVC
jgi:hypothetical protein